MTAIWWIRRDLRLTDNLSLQAALKHDSVIPLFIFDPYFEKVSSRRRNFLINNLRKLQTDLEARGGGLVLRSGDPGSVLREIVSESCATEIFAEEDYSEALYAFNKVYRRGYEDNANINYRIGVCLINIPGRKTEAIPYLEKAVTNVSDNYKEGSFREERAAIESLL